MCIPLIIFVVCNVWVIGIVLKNINARYKIRNCIPEGERDKFNDNIRKMRRNKMLHLFRVFGSLLISNAIAWLPTIVLVLHFFFVDGLQSVPIPVSSFAHILFYSQVFIHPFLETALIKDVRNPARKMICFCCIKLKDECSSSKDKSGAEIERKDNRLCCAFCCSHGHKNGSKDDSIDGSKDGSPCMKNMFVFWNICNASLLNEEPNFPNKPHTGFSTPQVFRDSSIHKIPSQLTITTKI